MLNIPIVTAAGHGDAIPYSHPLNAGSAGPRGSGLGTKTFKRGGCHSSFRKSIRF